MQVRVGPASDFGRDDDGVRLVDDVQVRQRDVDDDGAPGLQHGDRVGHGAEDLGAAVRQVLGVDADAQAADVGAEEVGGVHRGLVLAGQVVLGRARQHGVGQHQVVEVRGQRADVAHRVARAARGAGDAAERRLEAVQAW